MIFGVVVVVDGGSPKMFSVFDLDLENEVKVRDHDNFIGHISDICCCRIKMFRILDTPYLRL